MTHTTAMTVNAILSATVLVSILGLLAVGIFHDRDHRLARLKQYARRAPRGFSS